MRCGRVTVGEQMVTDPARAVGPDDVVAVDSQPVALDCDRVVFALNKPAGFVSTASDPQGRPTVVSLVPTELRLYPVGRLDVDTTGLILLANDGELAHQLTHPRYEVPKTYRVLLRPAPVRDRALRALAAGVALEDGLTAPAGVRRLGLDTLEITIHEGRKRQVRRMCEAVGHRVAALERVRLGPLALGDLAPGAYRRLSPVEVSALRGAAAGPERRGNGEGANAAGAARHAAGSSP